MNFKEFSIEGAEHIQKALLELPHQYASRGMKSAFRAGARVVADEAKRRAPVRTGKLRKSIVVRDPAKSQRLGKDSVVVVAIKKPASKIAHLIEFGTTSRRQKNGRFTGDVQAKPFLRPALDLKASTAIRVIQEKTAQNIETIATQLARGQKVSLRAKKK